MAVKLEQLKSALIAALGGKIVSLTEALGELNTGGRGEGLRCDGTVAARRPGAPLRELIDLCGVDYSNFGEVSSGFGERQMGRSRFAVVLHLLSQHNAGCVLRGSRPTTTFPSWTRSPGSARRELVRARGLRLVRIIFTGHEDCGESSPTTVYRPSVPQGLSASGMSNALRPSRSASSPPVTIEPRRSRPRDREDDTATGSKG